MVISRRPAGAPDVPGRAAFRDMRNRTICRGSAELGSILTVKVRARSAGTAGGPRHPARAIDGVYTRQIRHRMIKIRIRSLSRMKQFLRQEVPPRECERTFTHCDRARA